MCGACRTGITHYTPNVGTGAIRAALVKKLADENGLTYAANEIVVTNGAKQAIWQSLLAVCSPGDEVRFHTNTGPHIWHPSNLLVDPSAQMSCHMLYQTNMSVTRTVYCHCLDMVAHHEWCHYVTSLVLDLRKSDAETRKQMRDADM